MMISLLLLSACSPDGSKPIGVNRHPKETTFIEIIELLEDGKNMRGAPSGYLSADGKFIIPPIYDEINPFSKDGIALVASLKGNGSRKYDWQLINTKGEIIRNLPYEDCCQLSTECNRYGVDKNGKCGVVDDKNKVIIPIEYDSFSVTESELIIADKNDRLYVFDMNGNLLFEFESTYALTEVYDNISIFKALPKDTGDLTASQIALKTRYGIIKNDGTLLREANAKSITRVGTLFYVKINDTTSEILSANAETVISGKNISLMYSDNNIFVINDSSNDTVKSVIYDISGNIIAEFEGSADYFDTKNKTFVVKSESFIKVDFDGNIVDELTDDEVWKLQYPSGYNVIFDFESRKNCVIDQNGKEILSAFVISEFKCNEEYRYAVLRKVNGKKIEVLNSEFEVIGSCAIPSNKYYAPLGLVE